MLVIGIMKAAEVPIKVSDKDFVIQIFVLFLTFFAKVFFGQS